MIPAYNVPVAMTDKVKKIELEFAEARKEIMQLRLENRKLETALTMLSKPMVLSEDEHEGSGRKKKRPDNSGGDALVIALPQGEALTRIDALLNENAKLAEEIVQLRQGGGVSSIYEKNTELSTTIKELETRISEMEKQNVSSLKQVQSRADRDMRQQKSTILYELLYLIT